MTFREMTSPVIFESAIITVMVAIMYPAMGFIAAHVYAAACQKDLHAFVPQGYQKQRKRVDLSG